MSQSFWPMDAHRRNEKRPRPLKRLVPKHKAKTRSANAIAPRSVRSKQRELSHRYIGLYQCKRNLGATISWWSTRYLLIFQKREHNYKKLLYWKRKISLLGCHTPMTSLHLLDFFRILPFLIVVCFLYMFLARRTSTVNRAFETEMSTNEDNELANRKWTSWTQLKQNIMIIKQLLIHRYHRTTPWKYLGISTNMW